MNTTFRFLFGAMVGLVWASAGCTVLKPVPDPTRFYVLDAPVTGDSAFEAGGLSVGLRRIIVPEYLKVRTMAVRRGRTEVVYEDTHRWAEGFEDSLHRAVAAHVLAAPSVSNVTVPPWKARRTFDRELQLRIDACEGRDDGTVVLSASWRVDGGKDEHFPRHGHGAFQGQWTPGQYHELAAEISELVRQLCQALLDDLW